VIRVLALDSALARSSATVVCDDEVVASCQQDGSTGQTAVLPGLAQQALTDARMSASALDLVAVTIGPGSFTGIRAALALAHGIALAAGVPIVGVTLTEALADALPHLGGRLLWTAIDSRRGNVFLDRGEGPAAVALDALPLPLVPVAVAGNAAKIVAACLAARGVDVMLTDARMPAGRHIAAVALRRLAGELPSLPAQPLYVDPPEARPPAGGLRPPPAT
jgi:tRNA threonylcarbamoyl adenosine modification protein YeaZ